MTRACATIRALLVAGAVCAAPLVVSTPALGAGPSHASLSDTEVIGSTIRTVLTVPATTQNVNIKAGSVTATLGGKPVTVTVSPVQDETRTAVVVIDTSRSMGASGIAAATGAARAYLAQTPADVMVALVTFSDKAKVLVRPTRDRTAVSRALAGLRANGETALYDGLQLALKTLPAKGSRSILLLSDGGDTVSKAQLSATLDAVARSGIRVEVVGFKTLESQNTVLASVARSGRGRLLPAGDNVALGNAFRAAARALAGQVRLTIVAPNALQATQPLVVAATANNQSVQATATIAPPIVPAAPPAAAPTPTTLPSTLTAAESATKATAVRTAEGTVWQPATAYVAAALVFVGLVVVGWFVIAPVFAPKARRRILDLDAMVGAGPTRPTKRAAGPSVIGGQVLGLSDKLTAGRSSTAKAAALLERADLPLRTNEWYVLRVVAAVLVLSVALAVFRGPGGTFIGLAVGLLVGVFGPAAFLRTAASRRSKKFETQLPDTLTLMASSLTTGFSLAQSIDSIVRDAAQPTAKEFARALAETRIGSELEEGLDRLAHRMASTNLEWTIMAIRIQRQVGGNLAETLRTTAATLRDRESIQRHVRALSAEGRMSAYILVAMPIGLFFYMYAVNRPYLSLLWQSPLGWAMIVIAVLDLLVGMLWMSRVVKVNV